MFNDYFDPDKAARQKSRRATDIDRPRKRNTVLGIVCLVMYVIVVNYVEFYQGLIGMKDYKKLESKIEELKAEVERLKSQDSVNGRVAFNRDEAKYGVFEYGIVIPTSPKEFDPIRESGRKFTTREAGDKFARAERLRFEAVQAMHKSWGDERPGWGEYDLTVNAIYSASDIIRHYDNIGFLRFKEKSHADEFADRYSIEDIKLMISGGYGITDQGLIMYQVKIFSAYSGLCVVTFDEMLKRQAYDFQSELATYLSDDYYTDVIEVYDSLP